MARRADGQGDQHVEAGRADLRYLPIWPRQSAGVTVRSWWENIGELTDEDAERALLLRNS